MKYPVDPSTYFIKRIIGLPGETVTINDGKVSIKNKENPTGFALDEKFISEQFASHDAYQITLGPTEYFVMGDNRRESSDSRRWGPLERDLIVGRPMVRLFPLSKIAVSPGKISDTTYETIK